MFHRIFVACITLKFKWPSLLSCTLLHLKFFHNKVVKPCHLSDALYVICSLKIFWSDQICDPLQYIYFSCPINNIDYDMMLWSIKRFSKPLLIYHQLIPRKLYTMSQSYCDWQVVCITIPCEKQYYTQLVCWSISHTCPYSHITPCIDTGNTWLYTLQLILVRS